MSISKFRAISKFDSFLLICLFSYFLFMVFVAFSFYDKGYYSIYNVFFDDDPNTNIASMAYSVLGGSTRNAYTHLFLELVSIPINVMAKFMGFNPEYMSLIVSPFMMSVMLFFFYKTLCFNFCKLKSSLITIVFSLSFCNFIFGVMPSTYPQGLLSIILINYYFVKSIFDKRSSDPIWLCISIFAASITITNVIIFSIYYFVYKCYVRKDSLIISLRKTAIISIVSVAFILLLYISYTYFFKGNVYGNEGKPEWIIDYLSLERTDVINKLKNLLNTFYFSFIPNGIEIRYIDHDKLAGLSFIKNKIVSGTGIAIAIMITSLIVSKLSPKPAEKELFVVSFLVILYNFTLHSVFSYEQYLYVLHWVLAIFMFILPVISRLHYSFILCCIGLQIFIIYTFMHRVDSLVVIG